MDGRSLPSAKKLLQVVATAQRQRGLHCLDAHGILEAQRAKPDGRDASAISLAATTFTYLLAAGRIRPCVRLASVSNSVITANLF
jgi:hypothetical protein